MEKLQSLKNQLSSFENVLVAFSGGTDSTFLLLTSLQVLGRDRVMPVMAVSEFVTENETAAARAAAALLGTKLTCLTLNLLKEPDIRTNPAQRCYYCKKQIFTALAAYGRGQGFFTVAEGSNADDLHDFRPGMRALTELGIVSPLSRAGLTKSEIRAGLKEAGFADWNRPASACLATRIPYGVPITPQKLQRISGAEALLDSMGFSQVRVRDHFPLARIEVPAHKLPVLAAAAAEISSRLKEFGWLYITADLDGYSLGSLNREVNTNE